MENNNKPHFIQVNNVGVTFSGKLNEKMLIIQDLELQITELKKQLEVVQGEKSDQKIIIDDMTHELRQKDNEIQRMNIVFKDATDELVQTKYQLEESQTLCSQLTATLELSKAQ